MLRFSVLTLFPDLIQDAVQTSITGRALRAGLIELQTIQIRDYAVNDYGQVDDALYGGGTGMLLRPEPIYAAWQDAQVDKNSNPVEQILANDHSPKIKTILLSPKGQVLNQKRVEELAKEDQLVLICGHYEGIDQRVLDEVVDLEISIGDYVLTGGEIAAIVLIDAVSRLVPGVLPRDEAHELESHSLGRLEQPHYTRPANWQGRTVPDVLTSGHQAKIDRHQYLASLAETMRKRPDLFNQLQLDPADYRDLIEFYRSNACQ
ncbi:MAG: tRNA (guanosine(37)-N1)-methyltransferase TrmD [Eubacteriales bacterium]|nr:tRNA (guanosine(37)-N1)-methyltransferase TrmD [Eubacteriales bacterium]